MTQDWQSDMTISDNQRAFAESLDIAVADYPAIEKLVEQIETSLGQNTMLEQSRWFVMSVLCHSNRSPWLSIEDSELDKEKQYDIAGRYIASDELKQSLRTVLKEDRCKFTLLRFAKSRNLEKRTLSTTTKAFKHAQSLLRETGLLDPAKAPGRKAQNKTRGKSKKEADNGSADRRAARRGYFEDDFLDFLNPQGAVEGQAVVQSRMSDEEFAELDAKIDMMAEPAYYSWSGAVSEDRSSLLIGLGAGCVMFAVIIWLFI